MPEPVPQPPSRGRRLLFILLSALLIVATIEVFSAIAMWVLQTPRPVRPQPPVAAVQSGSDESPPPFTGFDPRTATIIHPFLGYVADHRQIRHSGRSLEARQLGFPFNKEDLLHPPSPETLVVAIVGGSVAQHTYLYAREELLEGLARIERFAGRRIILVNLGEGGFKQPQQLIAIAYLQTLGAHFDLVINLDGFNEVALARTENIGRGTHPVFPRSWWLRTGELEPRSRRTAAEVLWLEDFRQSWSRWIRRNPWRYSATSHLIWSRIDAMIGQAIGTRERQLLEKDSPKEEIQRQLNPAEPSGKQDKPSE